MGSSRAKSRDEGRGSSTHCNVSLFSLFQTKTRLKEFIDKYKDMTQAADEATGERDEILLSLRDVCILLYLWLCIYICILLCYVRLALY